jgi:putative toxin-antitoxin system antitoxin component (TIGR02293 family)
MAYQALAEVLGINEPEDDAELVEMARNGLPGEVAELLASRLGISLAELSGFLHVSPRTLVRRRGKILSPGITDRLLTVARVYARCRDVFQSEDHCLIWLKSRILALGDARPIDLLDTNTGAEMVITVLGRIEHGVHS